MFLAILNIGIGIYAIYRFWWVKEEAFITKDPRHHLVMCAESGMLLAIMFLLQTVFSLIPR